LLMEEDHIANWLPTEIATEPYNLRLDEVTLEKLRWVGKNVTVSTHQWVVDVLKDAIETKIQETIDNK